jgi:hypothetical protein
VADGGVYEDRQPGFADLEEFREWWSGPGSEAWRSDLDGGEVPHETGNLCTLHDATVVLTRPRVVSSRQGPRRARSAAPDHTPARRVRVG